MRAPKWTPVKKRLHPSGITKILLSTLLILIPSLAVASEIDLTVDATDLPRMIVRSRMAMELAGDSAAVMFPKWIPGVHRPEGFIESMADFIVKDNRGQICMWERDHSEPYRFFVDARRGGIFTIDLTFISNQSAAMPHDTYGSRTLGIINWNTTLVYPEGTHVNDIPVRARLIMPEGWNYASAIPVEETRGDTIVFALQSLMQLIDKPLICGPVLHSAEIVNTDNARYLMHFAGAGAGDMPPLETLSKPFISMIRETEALFGSTCFDEYHFLITLEDALHPGGLEHSNSTLLNLCDTCFSFESWPGSWMPDIIAHEFIHAWCGKYRKPHGMDTPDYTQPRNMDLIWLYEGLTQYLGQVIAARCGFSDPDTFRGNIIDWSNALYHQKGRRWRPLRDVCVANSALGGWGNWKLMRRSRDFYYEGALMWLEFDARIRQATEGRNSLDDFCSVFFGGYKRESPLTHSLQYRTYNLEEILTRLDSLAAQPWDSLIEVRIYRTQQELDLGGMAALGSRFRYTSEKPPEPFAPWAMAPLLRLSETVGFSIYGNGQVTAIVPGSPADRAGLYPRARIIGVNDKDYSPENLLDAIRQSPQTGRIIVVVVEDGESREIAIQYDAGEKYLNLVRTEGTPDRLGEIIAPAATSE